ncbi:hypothetical protein SNOUR_02960 [Streptomyces noursei ATCC 11455]|nr:hypothetical protein SNOUR_02960 [Streptomyces noursei ATCC 11455]
MASSTSVSTGWAPRSARTSAFARRPGAAIMSALVAPFVHRRPELVGCALSPDALATRRRPSAGYRTTSRTIPQPTPQYEQTVRTLPSFEPDATETPLRGACTFPSQNRPTGGGHDLRPAP